MFAYALRAVILLGVVGWYSTGVWKMIDGYFKDKFDKYLREEYSKNPRIKIDLDAYRIKNNKNKKSHDNNNENNDKSAIDVNIMNSNKFNNKNKDNEMNRKNLITHSSVMCHEDQTCKKDKNIEISGDSECQKRIQSPQLTKNKPSESTANVDLLKKTKKLVKTLTFSDDDFKIAKMKVLADYDFSEFEYNDDKKSSDKIPGGIRISDLPFKPKADLSNLDIITEDEYCPISLNYEENCKDIKRWP